MSADAAAGPTAPRRRSVQELHGHRREDDYAWLSDITDPAVIDHLDAEREHYERVTAPLAAVRQALLAEMLGRSPEAEVSPTWQRGGVTYRTRRLEGAERETLVRLDPSAPDGPGQRDGPDGSDREQVVLDLDELAHGSPHVGLGCLEPSPDGRLVAHSVDFTGEELYELRFRDVATGRDLPDRVFPVRGGGAWSADGTTFFYTVPDDSYRPFQVLRHRLGTPVARDQVVHEETDRRFSLSVRATRDGRWIVVESASLDTTEVRLVSARYLAEQPRVVALRRPGVEYHVDVLAGGWSGKGAHRLLVVTNDRAPEFRLVEAPLPAAGVPGDPAAWAGVERALTSPGERLDGVTVLAHHVVLSLRRDCEPFLRVVDRVPAPGARGSREIHAALPCGQLQLWHAEDVRSRSVVVVEQNLVTAPVWVRVDLDTGARKVLERTRPRGVDPTRYQTERLTARSGDGTLVPVTIARRRDLLPGTAQGCVLHGDGALEEALWPAFSLGTLSLLDRGVVVAIAHVRGGGELGRAWWEAGRLSSKQNTFDDYVAVRDRLVEAGWAGPGGVVTRGRSVGGGLLQGAVYSQAPDRWRAVVAEVPFVDVVTTLSDVDAPRVPAEREEWGSPTDDPQALAAVLSWSPYDNPPPPPRPPLLVTGMLHDPTVLVHEPAKWVARLRAGDSPFDPSEVLFRVELGPGAHTGPSGRTARASYEAEVLAWILDRMGLADR